MSSESKQKNGYILVMILYLTGIFMGAIDTGIVTPARTIIQSQLGVSATSGIWMITAYTLAYAASVPIMGKLADKFGRKYIYLVCIFLFGFGSFLCGLSGKVVGFPLLILARVIQAIGGGGIVPIATAEFGTTFPAEKRGMALGLVGGVYGIANVFGASAGSAILDAFGTNNWEFIFFINVPASIFIVICGCFALKNNRDEENNKKIDVFGIFALTIMVLSLLYGIKNLDFFDFANTFTTTKVYPFFIIFLVFIPIFVIAEKKAEDPVISLNYFTERNILITLILSTISGFVMMGVIFVPQFSENCLRLSTGSGGYLVIILGLFAGFGAPISGKLIDKIGPKLILGFGFAMSAVGALFMMFVTTKYPSLLTVIIGLAFAGLGMGFTMGTPINYMMLADTDEKQSNSALATVSLVRSIGTAIAPAIMVGFVANAGMSVQGKIMEVLPSPMEVMMSEMMGDMDISDMIGGMVEKPDMATATDGDMSAMAGAMGGMDMSAMAGAMGDMDMSSMMNSGSFELPPEIIEMLQSSDVTNIVDCTRTMCETMFEMMPFIPESAANSYLAAVDERATEIEDVFQETLNDGFSNIYKVTAITAGVAIIILLFYGGKKKRK